MLEERPWQKTLVRPNESIRSAIQSLDIAALQIVLVVNDEGQLLGTVTDGDVRRAILKGIDINSSVTSIMNRLPKTTAKDESDTLRRERMRRDQLHQMPVVDSEGRVVGLVSIDSLVAPAQTMPNWVVLMAGGLGKRLRPLTDSAPKPLLEVGNKPLLETILDSFANLSFRHFYISVNYKAEMIKRHFGDGSRFGVEIRYLEEDRPLGTAGALRLLPAQPDAPLIVMNADLLTRVNFRNLLDYHRERQATATMAVREYDFEVPYGVVAIEDGRIKKIEEKPVHSFFVNAGIYVLNPDLLELIPSGTRFDMTALFDRVLATGRATSVFPIREYWIDVGRQDDLVRANGAYEQEFKA
ncbi:MAG: CBS domain-containing protein [Rhodospirillales bacterium]|nr:CBS domain-containing protein [Rhodospirillales bacterium]